MPVVLAEGIDRDPGLVGEVRGGEDLGIALLDADHPPGGRVGGHVGEGIEADFHRRLLLRKRETFGGSGLRRQLRGPCVRDAAGLIWIKVGRPTRRSFSSCLKGGRSSMPVESLVVSIGVVAVFATVLDRARLGVSRDEREVARRSGSPSPTWLGTTAAALVPSMIRRSARAPRLRVMILPPRPGACRGWRARLAPDRPSFAGGPENGARPTRPPGDLSPSVPLSGRLALASPSRVRRGPGALTVRHTHSRPERKPLLALRSSDAACSCPKTAHTSGHAVCRRVSRTAPRDGGRTHRDDVTRRQRISRARAPSTPAATGAGAAAALGSDHGRIARIIADGQPGTTAVGQRSCPTGRANGEPDRATELRRSDPQAVSGRGQNGISSSSSSA